MSDQSIPCWVVKLVVRLGRDGTQETAPQLQFTLHSLDKIEFGLLIAESYRAQGGNCPRNGEGARGLIGCGGWKQQGSILHRL